MSSGDWPYLYGSLFSRMSEKEIGTWERYLFTNRKYALPELEEEEIEEALIWLSEHWQGKYSPKMGHIRNTIVRNRKKKLLALRNKTDPCRYCDNSGWIFYPYIIENERTIPKTEFIDSGMWMHREGVCYCCCEIGRALVSFDSHLTPEHREAVRRHTDKVVTFIDSIPHDPKDPQTRYLSQTVKETIGVPFRKRIVEEVNGLVEKLKKTLEVPF